MLNKTKETELLKTPVFTVVQKEFDHIQDFKPVGLKCNDWVMVIAADNPFDPKCVFVKQTRWGIESETTEFPCGTVENGESPEDAAKREFLEETGIVLDDYLIEELICFNPNPAYFSNRMHIFKVFIPNLKDVFLQRERQNLDKDEDCKVFIDFVRNQKRAVSKHAMGLIAYTLAKGE